VSDQKETGVDRSKASVRASAQEKRAQKLDRCVFNYFLKIDITEIQYRGSPELNMGPFFYRPIRYNPIRMFNTYIQSNPIRKTSGIKLNS